MVNIIPACERVNIRNNLSYYSGISLNLFFVCLHNNTNNLKVDERFFISM